jgi:radical SAM superfamily enzyme YgiQ (UPF0313 family)
MNVVIVTPGHPSPRRKSFPPALTAPYLSALAEPYVDHIKIIDLAVQPFDLYAPIPDIAMFTGTMAQFDHVFKVAKYMKASGAKIFLGGPYATLAYDFDPSIKELADCVVLGEGEKALPRALEDYKNGSLQPTYSIPINSLEGLPFSRLDLLDNSKYFSSTVVIGTRGCVHKCAYCSIGDMYGQKYLKRPVDEVIEEIKFQTSRPKLQWLDRKLVQFWDDNPACDLNWFHNLLEKLIPLKKWWLSQICLNVADNEETVKLMKASGCKGIFVGIESVSEETLRTQNKEAVNIVNNYIRQCRTIIKHGMVVVGAIMFGFDTDTKEILFDKTLEILEKMGITMLNNLVFTPYPHLDYYKTLAKEDRLITKIAKYYNGYTVVHRPNKIHPADLQEGIIKMHKKFYSWPSIYRRMVKHNILKYPEFLIWNRLWGTTNHDVIPGVNVNQWLKYLRTL